MPHILPDEMSETITKNHATVGITRSKVIMVGFARIFGHKMGTKQL